jgi:transposase
VAEEQEQLLLNQRERDRLKVLHELKQGHLTQRAAAEQLRLSERWTRTLLKRLKKRGDRAVVHGLRGRASNRRVKEAVKKRAVGILRREYADFGPTLASEYLSEQHGLEVSKETVRKWMVEAGLRRVRAGQVEEVHLWRPRRACFGELVQWDTSVHDWLEGRSEGAVYLIAMIDDATNRLLARFAASDSSGENRRLLWQWLERYGRPVAFYTDKASLFQPVLAPGWRREEPGPKTETQIGRALRELGIEWIAAHSPQAKGRVERCFGTLQDRLVKALRTAGVKTIEEANAYLEQVFLPAWNERFAVSAANPTDAHRPLGPGQDLASSLSFVQTRKVANDYTIRWQYGVYQIPPEAVHPGLRASTVEIEQRLNGEIRARLRGTSVRLARCEPAQKPPPPPARPARKDHNRGQRLSQWMQGFTVSQTPSWKFAREDPWTPV